MFLFAPTLDKKLSHHEHCLNKTENLSIRSRDTLCRYNASTLPEIHFLIIFSLKDVLSAYHFKLALHSSQYHVGEVHWGQFTESLISLLPYRWQHPADTTLQTAHFVKKQPLTFATQEREHNTGPAAESKAIKPNAVVIKRQKAIEVLNIESGQPLCSYDISTRATSVGDLNDDNVVDHVTAFFASERTDHSGWISPCTGNAFSGRKSLFSRSICHSPSTFGSFFDSFSEEDLRDEPELVSPLLVPSPPNKRGIFSHLSGESFKRDSIRSLDSIFVISSGRLTSLGPFGELNWQVRLKAGIYERSVIAFIAKTA